MKCLWLITYLALGTAAVAQPCEPYWAGDSSVPNAAIFQADSQLWAVERHLGNAYFRVHRRACSGGWELLPTQGLPQNDNFIDVKALDDGAGLRLYVMTRASPDNPRCVRWTGATWEMMPEAFITKQWKPNGWADFGDGPRIYGVRGWDGGSLRRFGRWTGSEWEELA
jgi:hypothetical protein